MKSACKTRVMRTACTVLFGLSANALAAEGITDEAQYASQKAYASLETRLQRLSEAGRPQTDYMLAKAQCWLDVSFQEFSRNDRSAFVAQAMAESRRLIQSMEDPSSVTPSPETIDDTPVVRRDLWARVHALKEHGDWRCAAGRLACAEVELVHAAHAYSQAGWRHAAPYVQIAEDRIADAEALATQCRSTSAPTQPTVASRPAATNDPSTATIILSTDTLFRSNDAHLDDQSNGVASLDELISRLKIVYSALTRVTLIGHSDEMVAHHTADYNVALSRRRAQAVADYLAAHGIASDVIVVQGRGALDPLARCEPTLDGARRIACLAPDRRVEVVVEGVRKTS